MTNTSMEKLTFENFNITGSIDLSSNTVVKEIELINCEWIPTRLLYRNCYYLKETPYTALNGNINEAFNGCKALEKINGYWLKPTDCSNAFRNMGTNTTNGTEITTEDLPKDRFGQYRLPDSVTNMGYTFYESLLKNLILPPLNISADLLVNGCTWSHRIYFKPTSDFTLYLDVSDKFMLMAVKQNMENRSSYNMHLVIHLNDENYSGYFAKSNIFTSMTLINELNSGYPTAIPSLSGDQTIKTLIFEDYEDLPKNNDNTQSYYHPYGMYLQANGLTSIQNFPLHLAGDRITSTGQNTDRLHIFNNAATLKITHITFCGTLECNFDITALGYTPDSESIQSLIDHLGTVSGKTLRLSTAWKNAMSNEQKQTILNKGFSIA
jgi:hypothetical protein